MDITKLIEDINKRINYLQTLPKHEDEQVNKIRLAEIYHLRKHIELINKSIEKQKIEIYKFYCVKCNNICYSITNDTLCILCSGSS